MYSCTSKPQQHRSEAESKLLPSMVLLSIRMAPLIGKSLKICIALRMKSVSLLFEEFLFTETPQIKSSSLPVKKIYLNRRSLFSFDVADYKGLSTPRTIASSQRVVQLVTKQFALGEKKAS